MPGADGTCQTCAGICPPRLPSPRRSLTVSLTAVAVLAVPFVAVIATVRSFLRGGEQFSGLFLVFGDQGLSLLLRQLSVDDLI